MTDSQILEKYGKEIVAFTQLKPRNKVIYKNVNGLKVTGSLDERTEIGIIETVGNLWNELNSFKFEVTPTNSLQIDKNK